MSKIAATAEGYGHDDHTFGRPLVPRYPTPSPDPLADGMLSHYLNQARAAEQVRRVIAASGLALDEDDGA